MKKYRIALISFFVVVAIAIGIKANNTDIWNLSGQGIYNAQDMATLDNQYNFRLYNGSIFLGDNALQPTTANTQVTPSITVGGYYGLKVPFVNGSSSSTVNGSIVVSSASQNSSSLMIGSLTNVTATTTVLGVADGVYAPGAIGYMTISGYALVQTTGTINIGQLIVSTATTALAGTGFVGLGGAATGTVVAGTVIGKALTSSPGTGIQNVLALITQE